MPRKSNGKKRGFQRGVAKHKVRSKESKTTTIIGGNGEEIQVEEYESLFFGIPQSTYFKLGRLVFEILFRASEKLHLLPYTRTEEGEYVPLEGKKKILHYVALAVGTVTGFHKLAGTAYVLLYEELKIGSFMCVSLLLIYFTAMCIASVTIARPKETMDLLNAWPKLLSCLKKIDAKDVTPLDDMSTSLKVIVVFSVTQGIAFAAAVLSLVMSHLPLCWFPTAESMGLIPDGVLPRFGWQVVFFPLEYATYLPPMFIAPYAGSLILVAFGIMKIYLRRTIKVKDLESRELVERMYICIELYNRVLDIWLRFILPPTIFSLSSSIIVTVFVAIRYTELPLIFYIFFPYTGCSLMFIIFWFSYDGVCIVTASEDILGDLTAYDAES